MKVASQSILSPFRWFVKGTKKMSTNMINFIKYDELQELSDALDSTMNTLTVSLEKIKQSTKEYRERAEAINAYAHAGQSIESVSKEPETFRVESSHGAYLQNRIWQNHQN